MFGFLLFSIIKISSKQRLPIFILSNMLSDIFLIMAVNEHIFYVMLPLVFLGGFFNALINVIQLTVVQASTPDEMRGKVLAFVSMTTQSLSPFAMALGGIIAMFIPIRIVISFSFTIPILVVTPFAFVKSFKRFINCSERNELSL